MSQRSQKENNEEGIAVSDFYQAIFNLKGNALSYKYFPFWVGILNSPHLTTRVRQSARKMVWEFSRQVGKSTNIGIFGLGNAIRYDNFTTIITQPTDTQISRFSVDTLKKINMESITTSIWFYNNKLNERQVKNKSFTTGSRIILANIYSSVLSAHGIPGDATIFDEAQLTPKDHIAQIEESTRRSEHRYVIYSGNPLDEGNHLHQSLLKSKHKEWAVPCKACRKWNVPLDLDNVGLKGLICEHCGKRINTRDGIWVARNRSAIYDGYHASELMVPQDCPGATDWQSLIDELRDKDKAEIWPEILGLPYSVNTRPISDKMIRQLCDPQRDYIRDRREITSNMCVNTVAGLDWALEMSPKRGQDQIKSYTILTIAKITGAGNLKVLFVKRYLSMQYNKPDETIKDIVKWCNLFKVKILGLDYGAGHKENQRIIAKLGHERTMEMQYVGGVHDSVVYDADLLKFMLNRTAAIDVLIERFQEGRIEFARYDGETSEYKSDLTNVYLFHDPASRQKRYGKTGADDWLHSLVYTDLAARQYLEELKYKIRGEGY